MSAWPNNNMRMGRGHQQSFTCTLVGTPGSRQHHVAASQSHRADRRVATVAPACHQLLPVAQRGHLDLQPQLQRVGDAKDAEFSFTTTGSQPLTTMLTTGSNQRSIINKEKEG